MKMGARVVPLIVDPLNIHKSTIISTLIRVRNKLIMSSQLDLPWSRGRITLVSNPEVEFLGET